MQQVGRQHFSVRTATVDPGLLPVAIRPQRRRRLVAMRHWWVLHKTRASRGLLVLALLALVGAGYVMRDDIAVAGQFAGDLVNARLADAGLGVQRISMTGQVLTSEAEVMRALAIADTTSILSFSPDAARSRLEALDSVATATVRKNYPDEVAVTLTEPEPVARWRMDGQTRLVDAGGRPIAQAVFEDSALPLVIGAGAADDALPMINLVERYPELAADLAALARVGDRRWDLLYYTGLRVQLPETGVAAALSRLDRFQREHQLLARDVTVIDMRVPHSVAVIPAEREPEEDQS